MALRTTRQMVEVLSTGDGGKTRVTRQSAAVLAAGIGKLRVHRQMIEVLAGELAAEVYEASASSALSLTTTLHVNLMQVTGASALSITTSAVRELSKNRAAESTIVLTQDADIRNEAVSVISLVQDVSVLRIANKVGTSTIVPGQILDYDLICHRLVTSPLTLTQEAIYHGPITASAATPLALTGTAYRCQTFYASAQSSLTLTTAIGVRGTIRVSASNALSLLSLADRGVFNRSAANELVLSQSASPDYRYTAVSILELTSTAVQGQVFGNAVSTLSLTQIARSNPLTAGPGPEYDFLLPPTVIDLQQHVKINIHMLTAQSTLTLADTLGVKRPWYLAAQSEVQTVTQVFDPATHTLVDVIAGLSDAATATKKMVTPFVSHHYLQLTDRASVVRVKTGAISASASNTLSLDYDVYINRTGLAVSHFDLAVSASVDKCTSVRSALQLSDSALGNIVELRLVHSHLGMGQSLGFTVTRAPTPRRVHDPNLYNYCPFVGEGVPGAPPSPPSILDGPLPGVTTPFQLLYPATGTATDSITLRTPNFGNKDRLSFNRVLRETRGGTLIVYADPIWPKIQTLVLSFSGLKTSEKDDLLDFLETHLGLEIGLLDWEHRYWRGVVVTPDDPIVQDDRNSFSVSFEFEGELDPTWP